MSKNNQRNQSEINLGNDTYNRGYADGVAGNPKTIKKTHRHAHRYHIGYRHGQDQAKRMTGPALTTPDGHVRHVHHKLPVPDNAVVRALIKQQDTAAVTFWKRLRNWLTS